MLKKIYTLNDLEFSLCEWAVLFVNRGNGPKTIDFDWKQHERIEDAQRSTEANFTKNTYKLRDLFSHKDLGTTDQVLKQVLNEHDVLMLRLRKL